MPTSLSTKVKHSHLLRIQVKQTMVAIIVLNTEGVVISSLMVKINGKRYQASELVRRIQMIFQDPAVWMNVQQLTIYHFWKVFITIIYLRMRKKEEAKKQDYQRSWTLSEHLTRWPIKSSGDNVNVSGLLYWLQPDFVRDEPISAFDVSVRAQVLNLLKKFQRTRLGLSLYRPRFVCSSDSSLTVSR